MKVKSIFEIAINVKNLEESTKYYKELLGLEDGLLQQERRWNFLWLNGREGMIVLIEKQNEIEPLHFAFRVEPNELDEFAKKLKDNNVKTSLPANHEWMNGTSIYFEDPNGHELELITL